MKKILFTLLAILMVGDIHAQVSFYQGDKKLNDGDTIIINDATTMKDGSDVSVSMDSKLKLKNESNETSRISCSQHVESFTKNGLFQFCVGSCTIGTIDKTLSISSIAAGTFINGFDIVYAPEYQSFGKAIATYTANIVGSSEKSKVTVIFNYQSTEAINSIQTNKVRVYSNTESLILESPTCSVKSVTIYNISGKVIAFYTVYGSLKEYILPKVEKKGLYLYSVEIADGKKITGKFINPAR